MVPLELSESHWDLQVGLEQQYAPKAVASPGHPAVSQHSFSHEQPSRTRVLLSQRFALNFTLRQLNFFHFQILVV